MGNLLQTSRLPYQGGFVFILAGMRDFRIRLLHPGWKPFKMRQLIPMTYASSIPADSHPLHALARHRLGKLCVAIQAGSAAEMIERAEAALADAKFLEFRLDSLAKPAAALPKMKEFLAEHRDVTAIATCRRKAFGGQFAGSLTAELQVLLDAAEGGCEIVDLEVESAEEAKPSALKEFRKGLRAEGTALLISFHDFSRTRGLEQAADRIKAFEPDYVKVVSTAKTLADNLAVLKLI